MPDVPFYLSGLNFSCKRCSACCRYDAGYVYLSENDLEKLANKFKIDNNSFIKTYCRWITDWGRKRTLSLKEKSNKDCIFWDSGCMVYNERPLQCRTFPFWENILVSAKGWETAASGCPGMNTGAMHTREEIEAFIKLRTTEPIIKR